MGRQLLLVSRLTTQTSNRKYAGSPIQTLCKGFTDELFVFGFRFLVFLFLFQGAAAKAEINI